MGRNFAHDTCTDGRISKQIVRSIASRFIDPQRIARVPPLIPPVRKCKFSRTHFHALSQYGNKKHSCYSRRRLRSLYIESLFSRSVEQLKNLFQRKTHTHAAYCIIPFHESATISDGCTYLSLSRAVLYYTKGK